MYANRYANQPQIGVIRGCPLTYVKRCELQKPDISVQPQTYCASLGVKWSQVQILSARPLK